MSNIREQADLQSSLSSVSAAALDVLQSEERDFLASHHVGEEQYRGFWTPTKKVAAALVIPLLMRAYEFASTDPTVMGGAEKAVRAIFNAAITAVQMPPIVATDMPTILTEGAAATALAGGAVYLIDRGSEVLNDRNRRKEREWLRSQARVFYGRERITYSNHTLIFDPTGHKDIDYYRDIFSLPVLVSSYNPYQAEHLSESDIPAYPTWVYVNDQNRRAEDDEILRQANIYDARSMVFFTQPDESTIFIDKSQESIVEERVRQALKVVSRAYEMRRKNNIFNADDFDVVIVAPSDIVLKSAPIVAGKESVEATTNIWDYLQTEGVHSDFIAKHVHIVDPRRVLAESLEGLLKDKEWAISVDPCYQDAARAFFDKFGFKLGKKLADANALLTYLKNDLRVITDPTIIQAALNRRGKFVPETASANPLPQMGGIVAPIDAAEQVDEVKQAFAINFAQALKAEIDRSLRLREEAEEVPLVSGDLNQFIEVLQRYTKSPRNKWKGSIEDPAPEMPSRRVTYAYYPQFRQMEEPFNVFRPRGWERLKRQRFTMPNRNIPAYVITEDTGEFISKSQLIKRKTYHREAYARWQTIYVMGIDPKSGETSLTVGTKLAIKRREAGHLTEEDIGRIPLELQDTRNPRILAGVKNQLTRLIGGEKEQGLLQMRSFMLTN